MARIEVVALDNILAAGFAKERGINKETLPGMAIRIFGGPNDITSYWPFNESPYNVVSGQVFDDIDPVKSWPGRPLSTILAQYRKHNYVPFNKRIARQIICDVRSNKDDVHVILVHCYAGQSRSPAVAMALNHIFSLGNKGMGACRPCKEYRNYNRYVYRTMMDAAR